MRVGPVFRTFAALAASILVLPCWSQAERRVSILPERPLAGSAFVVEVILPGEPAEAVVPLEPALRGPARYTGADVRPGQDGDGQESAVLSYRFQAGESGTVDVVDLSARSGQRLLQFGSWSIDVVSGTQALPRRYGAWSAPGEVLVRELFTVTALGPDGNPAACPSFAVEGSLFEPVPGKPGSFRAVALEPGSLRLPQLELGAEAGRFVLRSFSISVRDLPAGAGDVDAVGGPWSLEIIGPSPGISVSEHETVAWEVQASGPGWPGLAAAPELTIDAPDGSSVTAGAGLAHSGRTGTAGGSFSARRGAFVVHSPGVYTIEASPFTWFDPSTRTVKKAMAPAVRITASAAPEPAWNVPDPVSAQALAWLEALADGDAAWSAASEAAARGDWAAARLEANLAAGISEERGSLSSASLRGNDAAKLARAAAAATLVAMSPSQGASGGLRAAALRAEAYAVFLRLERTAFPVRGAGAMADAAAASFGNLDRDSYVLPPFGWVFVAGLACAVAAAVPAVLQRKAGGKGVALRTWAVIMTVLVVAVLSLAVASFLERRTPRFVSLGGPARAVPSDLAAEAETVDAGRTGRVLESTARWSFVELDEGGAVWISVRDAAHY